MSKVRLAKEFVVKVGNMVVARCTDFSFSLGKNTVDITSFDSDGFEEYLADNKNWNINFGSMVTREDVGDDPSGVFIHLFDEWASAATDYPVYVAIGEVTGAASGYYAGTGILTDLAADGAVGDKATYSGTIQGSGKISRKGIGT